MTSSSQIYLAMILAFTQSCTFWSICTQALCGATFSFEDVEDGHKHVERVITRSEVEVAKTISTADAPDNASAPSTSEPPSAIHVTTLSFNGSNMSCADVLSDGQSFFSARNRDYQFSLSGPNSARRIDRLDLVSSLLESSSLQIDCDHAFCSIEFGGWRLCEVIKRHRSEFIFSDYVEADGKKLLAIDGAFKAKLTGLKLQDVRLLLDPLNSFQILNASATLVDNATRINEKTEMKYFVEYGSASSSGPEVKLPSRVQLKSQNARGETFVTIDYKKWRDGPLTDEMFRLSGHGLPEPDLKALRPRNVWLVRVLLLSVILGFGYFVHRYSQRRLPTLK